MATRKLKQKQATTVIAGAEVTTCPRPDCPNPTLHIAMSGANYHCIGCWRRFPRSGRLRVAQQKPPPKSWLREFSPERLNGPPPKLPIRLRLRAAGSGPSTPPPVSIATGQSDSLPAASVATENDDSFVGILTSSEDDDDDVPSTGRYDRSVSPSTPGIDGATDPSDSMFSSPAYSRYVAGPSRRPRSLSIAPSVIDEDCGSPASSHEVISSRSRIVRALKLIQGGKIFKACRGRSTGRKTGLMQRFAAETRPERMNGPSPKLDRMKFTIRLRLKPAGSGPSIPPPVSIATGQSNSLPAASVATENDDSFVGISTSSEKEDDDCTSTGRYDGATASWNLPSSFADSRCARGPSSRSVSPSTPGIDGATDPADSMFSSPADSRYVAGPSRRPRSLSIAPSVIAEDCESPGSSHEVIPFRSRIVRALKLIHGGMTFKACRGSSIGIKLKLIHGGKTFKACRGRSIGMKLA